MSKEKIIDLLNIQEQLLARCNYSIKLIKQLTLIKDFGELTEKYSFFNYLNDCIESNLFINISKSTDLLKRFADASDALLKLKIIRKNSFTGEIGEYVVIKQFILTLATKTAKDIDAKYPTNELTFEVKTRRRDYENLAVLSSFF